MKTRATLLWAPSIAMAWTWGLGLFFSVQVTLQFGIPGLLWFAIPNALGLVLFGQLLQTIARGRRPAELEDRFFAATRGYGWVFLLYQFLALSLTFFSAFRYVLMPLGVSIPLGALLFLGAALFLGERFDIARVKYSHGAMAIVTAAFAAWIVARLGDLPGVLPARLAAPHEGAATLEFAGACVAMVVGFLLGPWLDLQQWQRALRIHREGGSIAWAYLAGAALFFLVLIFHGLLASMLVAAGGDSLIVPARDGLFHAKDAGMRFFASAGIPPSLRVAYVTFLALLLVTTLDSGSIALRWYLSDAVRRSRNVILSVLPARGVSSPLLPVLFCGLTGLVAALLRLELEYFMAFYASFAVGYEFLLLVRAISPGRAPRENAVASFALAAVSLGLFGIGYFETMPLLVMAGTLVPLIHGVATVLLAPAATREEPEAAEPEGAAGPPRTVKISASASATLPGTITTNLSVEGVVTAAPQDIAHTASTWFEEKWFVHALTATYADTNSVGNIYFATYMNWVGKTRELFFRHAMPGFDLQTTPFFILTREFQHKFVREAREFERIFVRIRVASWNRKFVTLEHEILDGARTLLGKGKQVLFFVSRKDYSILDMPLEVQDAFRPLVLGPPSPAQTPAAS